MEGWRARPRAVLTLVALLSAASATVAVRALPVPGLRDAVPAPGEIAGIAEVTDGDTLRIGTTRIRLHAVDAPETGPTCGVGGAAWPCGRAAANRLAALVAHRQVRCRERDRDRYGRLVSICRVDGVDLGAALVSEGLARAYLRYGTDYAGAEATARAAGLGLWQGASEAPWEYRQAQARRADPRLEPVAAGRADAAAGPAGCEIKGNVATGGRRLYHLPGNPAYAATRIDPARGEAYFCSETEARAAGFRPARTP